MYGNNAQQINVIPRLPSESPIRIHFCVTLTFHDRIQQYYYYDQYSHKHSLEVFPDDKMWYKDRSSSCQL
ncbi:hypothetical protein AQUCO_03500124v1 [Aquilegia coerulea]|uniref:Uncharacterized protein n=1 Tax=Aquilegia coerulea TaxID=218851 RepID=A0A2G5CWA8_AQUCA|nr:hypothetical protein AQUCO_03500124v1 [Aquilegia coerulea]